MALSATAPLFLITSVTQHLNMPDYVLVSGSLNRPNLYFSLDSFTSISSVFHLLASMLSSVKYSKDIPKTLIFYRSKDVLYKVYIHLVYSCSSITRGTEGQYHATMTLEGRSQHYGEFKCGKQRVMVATSAFGLGVDIDDISEVILFGLPDSGSELVQLAGRGGRDLLRLCLVRFVAHSQDRRLSVCNNEIVTLASNKVCLRRVLVYKILQSDEPLSDSDLCCSFCNASDERPHIFQPEVDCTLPLSPIPCRSAPLRSRRVVAGQRGALLKLRRTAGGTRYRMRGLDGVLSMLVIDELVKKCNKIRSENNVRSIEVVRDFSLAVFKLIEFHIPCTIANTSSDGTRSTSACFHFF
ncbi:uncharacterized protein LOC134188296 [Corticium candelabrum]|uniref:uncharacterized protein LOC134188296 n=1 Tax=Corticium candelabrum TaxID=121492 RepID=UPI002E25E69F|nr:uncharacterized protein LOC134188296 [Corticium candelabrum]